MRNLRLRIKYSFSKINSALFFLAILYYTFIRNLLKGASKNLKRMLLVTRFVGFFFFFKVARVVNIKLVFYELLLL